MDKETLQTLQTDPDGLLTYEYLANHVDTCMADIDEIVDNMIRVDRTGQFLVSASRYLAAIDKEAFGQPISRMVASAIEKDRERRYIADLLEALYGPDYRENADRLNATDDNFRRIYKRIYPTGI